MLQAQSEARSWPTNSLVALFIDSENASPRHVDQVIAACRTLGHLTILRCYGGAAGLKKWEKANAEHHIVSVMTLASAAKANASDFALTIDAVSLLHRDMFDHAVIVSSDADFTQLAIHIREHGKGVHGIGEAKAAMSLKTSFDTFTLLSAAVAKRAKTLAAAKPAPRPATRTPAMPKAKAPLAAVRKAAKPQSPPKEIPKQELLQTYEKLAATGTVSLGVFGKFFRADYPDIEVGKGKLKKMLLNIGLNVDDKNLVTRKG